MRYLKALTAAIISGLGSLYVATTDTTHLTAHQWVAVAIATVTAGAATWAVPNTVAKPPPPA